MNRRPSRKDKRFSNVNNIVDMAKYKKKKIVSEEVKTFIKKDIVKDKEEKLRKIHAVKTFTMEVKKTMDASTIDWDASIEIETLV